jgi:hypothetical protein
VVEGACVRAAPINYKLKFIAFCETASSAGDTSVITIKLDTTSVCSGQISGFSVFNRMMKLDDNWFVEGKSHKIM